MATQEEFQRELANLARSVGTASSNIDSASKTSAGVSDALRLSLLTFANTVSSTASSLTKLENDFQKFDSAITSVSNSVQRFGVFFGKYGGAFKVITKTVESAFKVVTEFGENLTGFYDGLSSLGITAGKTTEQMLDMVHQAGYSLKTSKDFSKLIKESGTTLIALDETTAKGVTRLANIFNNIQVKDVQLEFLNLGLGPKELNKIQLEYIKSQATVGLKLTTNDDLLRESSIEYAKTLTKLSALTGETRDKVAQEIAKNRKDIRYALKVQELTAKGNQKAIDAFDKAGAIIGLNLGEDYSSGLRDFIANGTATTKEGEMLLFKTQGQIAKWVRDVEAGTIDEVELARRIAKAEQQFTQGNREALTFSDEFRERMSSSGDTIAGATRLLEIRSKEDVDKMVEAAGKRNDDIKKTQDTTIRAERNVSVAYDKLGQMLFGVGSQALLTLISLVKQTARGAIKLALMLPIEGELEESLKKLEAILGDDEQLSESKKELDEKIEDINKQLETRKSLGKAILTAQDDLKEAQERQPKLEAEVKKDPTSELAKETQKNNEILIERKKREIEILKRKEKELEEKRTKQELERDRKKLLEQSRYVDKQRRQTSKTKPEDKKEAPDQGKPGGKERKPAIVGKTDYIKGDLNRFANLDPKLQERILAMSEKYYSMTGKQLTITSSYRSEEEQLEMYNAWRDAGGRYPWESNPNPAVMTRFGRLYMPTKSGGQHSKGIAVDIPQNQLDYLDEKGLLDQFNLKRHRPIRQDPVHVTLKGKRGAVFSGPESGYNVELHGTEAIIPFNNKPIQVKINDKNLKLDNKNAFEELATKASEMRQYLHEKTKKVDLKSKDATVDFTGITNNIKAKIVNLQEFYEQNQEDMIDVSIAQNLVGKIESMISSVDQSNSIHNDLKMYLRN